MFKPRGGSSRKSRRQSRRPLGFPQIFVISFIVFILSTVFGLVLINKGIEPTLMALAKTKIESVAQQAITVAVNKQIKSMTDDIEYVHFTEDQNGTVISIDYPNVNMLETQTTMRVQNFLTKVENGEPVEYLNADGVEVDTNEKGAFITKIPLGQATNNALLANLGPEVPVRFRIAGNVNTNLKGSIKPLGINNVSYNVWIDIKVEARVIIPFATETKPVTSSIGVVGTVVPFDVPEYFGGTGEGGNSPAIVLPFHEKDKESINIPKNGSE